MFQNLVNRTTWFLSLKFLVVFKRSSLFIKLNYSQSSKDFNQYFTYSNCLKNSNSLCRFKKFKLYIRDFKALNRILNLLLRLDLKMLLLPSLNPYYKPVGPSYILRIIMLHSSMVL